MFFEIFSEVFILIPQIFPVFPVSVSRKYFKSPKSPCLFGHVAQFSLGAKRKI